MVMENDTWIGVNTSLTNRLVREALEEGVINDFGAIEKIQPEVKVSAHSRLDFMIQGERGTTYLEVKNCSLAENGIAMFPDAVTKRGTKHLVELADLRAKGFGAGLIFCIQRGDAESFKPAAHIDPLYAETLEDVCRQGVQAVAYQAAVLPEQITITKKIPIIAGCG